MFLSYDKWANWNFFDKDNYWFKILIKSKTNLKMTYKDVDQFDDLLKKKGIVDELCNN